MPARTIAAPRPTRLVGRVALEPTSTRFDAPRRTVELWSPWYGRQRPSTAADEAVFVARLRHLAVIEGPTSTSHARHDVTAIVTALRTALTVDEMLERAPGLRAGVLVAAYNELDARRVRATAAWQRIVAQPNPSSLETSGPVAEALLPVVIGHLRLLRTRRRTDLIELSATVREIHREIRRTVASAILLEAALDAPVIGQERAQQIGEVLYDRFGEGAWSLSTFLPPRVGTLVPARVAALLGEDRTERMPLAG